MQYAENTPLSRIGSVVLLVLAALAGPIPLDAAFVQAGTGAPACAQGGAKAPAGCPGAGPVKAGSSAGQPDAYRRWIALKREIARSEGRISDLRKRRDAEGAHARAGSAPAPAADGAAPSTPSADASPEAAEAASYYADAIAAEQKRLDALRKQDRPIAVPTP